MPFEPDKQPQAQPEQPKENTFWDTLKGVAGRAFYGPSQVMGGAIKAGKEYSEGTYQAPKTGINLPGWLNRSGEEKDVSSLIHPSFVGAFRGLRDKNSVMEELPKAINVDPESGKGIAIGLAGELMTPDIGDLALATKGGKALMKTTGKKVGKALEKTGEYIAEVGVKPTLSQSKKFYNVTKTTIGKFITDNKIAGNVAENIANKITKLQGDFDDIAINSGLKIKADQFGQAMGRVIAKLDPDLQVPQRKALIEFAESLGSRIKKAGEIGIEELTRKRKLLDDMIPEAQWQKLMGGDAVSSNVLKRQFLQDLIRETAGDLTSKAGKSLEDLGKELSHFYKLGNIVKTQEGVGVAGRFMGLGDLTALGAGAMKGGFPGAVASFIGRRVLSNPRVLGEGSKALYKTGEALIEQPEIVKSFAKPAIKFGKESLMGAFRPEEVGQQPEGPQFKGPTPGFIPD